MDYCLFLINNIFYIVFHFSATNNFYAIHQIVSNRKLEISSAGNRVKASLLV